MMKYPVLIFDFDGTLYDTSRSIASVMNRVREKLGLKAMDNGVILTHVGQGLENLLRSCLPEFSGSKPDLEKGFEQYKIAYMEDDSTQTNPEPGLMNFLENDPRKKFVLSNKTEAMIHQVLKEKGTHHHFCGIVGGDTFDFRKPDPRLLPEVLRICDAEASQCLMIGDDWPDIEFAENAGLDFVYCGFGFRGMKHSEGRTTIKSFDDLSNWLSQ